MSIPFDDLLANGFNTRQTDVRPANSVNTAFQLIAVIMQLQSLQEFGGVSATHLDWTMVPYVRKSFYKHYKDGLKYIAEEDMPQYLNDSLSIDDEKYTNNQKVYKYALDKTEQEVKQGAEGLFHNLNC
jgi:ribonucleoside-triphosphate reductase